MLFDEKIRGKYILSHGGSFVQKMYYPSHNANRLPAIKRDRCDGEIYRVKISYWNILLSQNIVVNLDYFFLNMDVLSGNMSGEIFYLKIILLANSPPKFFCYDVL